MSKSPQSPGCRNVALAVGLFIVVGLVLMALGLTLINDDSCATRCETLALTALYGGMPVSAALGVFFGGLILAWPLDITFWVVLGFLLARWCDRRERNVLGAVLVVIILSLTYGLVLSSFVEIAISS